MAQVEYPAKSKNICPEKASTPIQASKAGNLPLALNTASADSDSMLSASTTFMNSPSDNNSNPWVNCFFVAVPGVSNCGTNWGGRTIGPATRWGKKVTNREKSSKDLTGSLFFLYISMV